MLNKKFSAIFPAVAVAAVLGVAGCSGPKAGESSFDSPAALAKAMGDACQEYADVEVTDDVSHGKCKNSDFVILQVVTVSDSFTFDKLIATVKQQDDGALRSTTTVYGPNWYTISAAESPEAVKSLADKLGAKLANEG